MNKETTIATQFNLMRLSAALLSVLLLIGLYTQPVQAQNEGRWYNVEVLVFKRQGNEATTSENWRNTIELAYPESYRYLKAATSGSFSLLPQNTHQLGGYNYTLRRDENYKVLFHKAWQQQMQGKDKSPAIILDGGNEVGDHKELEGYIKIHIARYLHLTTDLWLTTDSYEQFGDSEWPKIPLPPGTTSTKKSSTTSADGINQQFQPLDFAINTKPISTLRAQRRMRSKELHYIDHPLMGLLILITPIEK
jgi:hypothetical protein